MWTLKIKWWEKLYSCKRCLDCCINFVKLLFPMNEGRRDTLFHLTDVIGQRH